jgi:DNA-directed RNA polymerase subunit RPC12/RpoP
MNGEIPSLYRLACPRCGNSDYLPLGKKRNVAQQIGAGLAAGSAPLLATWVMNAQAMNLAEAPTLQYQCAGCKKKYESPPLAAQPDEILPEAGLVTFTRAKMFRGAAGTQVVYLNGVPIKTLKNGESFSFQTILRYNTIFVGIGNGMVIRKVYRFEAQPGRPVNAEFDGNFRTLP